MQARWVWAVGGRSWPAWWRWVWSPLPGRRPAAGGRPGDDQRRRQVAALRRDIRLEPAPHGDRDRDGTASGTPDTAIVQLGVRTWAESANEALDLANQKATDLLAALDFGGVEKEDITTTNVFVYPQYGNDGRQITAGMSRQHGEREDPGHRERRDDHRRDRGRGR